MAAEPSRRLQPILLGLKNKGGLYHMADSQVATFADPDSYHAAIRAERVEGVLTARGNFHAELTRIDFDRLLMQRADENLARVLDYSAHSGRTAIIFATDQGQPAMHVSGMPLTNGEILAWDSRLAAHHRSAASSRWGTMSLTHEDLATFSAAIVGRELTSPSCARRIRPSVPSLSRLLSLHEAASHLAKTAPDILANPGVGRAMEQALIEAMVSCVAAGDPVDTGSAHRHHSIVMRRLEQVLEANSDELFYMAELCAAVGVSYPTLRACCQEHLGMSPKRYLWLRRML
jgi:hypothetical protein